MTALNVLINMTNRSNPVRVRRKDDKPYTFSDECKITDYIREHLCKKDIVGIGLYFFDMKSNPPTPIIPEGEFSFSDEQSATEFYHIMQGHSDYAPILPEGAVGLARLSNSGIEKLSK